MWKAILVYTPFVFFEKFIVLEFYFMFDPKKSVRFVISVQNFK